MRTVFSVDLLFLWKAVALITLIAGIISNIVWAVFRQRVQRKLGEMSRVTGKMSRLEFDEKVEYHGKGNLGELAESIDRMSGQLKQSIDGMNLELARRENLVRNLAHDIRTPVTIIKGYSENLSVLYPEDARVNRHIGVIVDECDRLTKMSGDMLEFFAIRDQSAYYKMEYIEAEELFEEFRRRTETMLPELVCEFEYDACGFYACREMLERGVYNLTENAIKYRDPGSVVKIIGNKEGDFYRFTLANEGEEIKEEDQKYIWDVFYKTDKARKRGNGYGLGLAIVREVASMHEGDVRAASRDGWTEMSFRIRINGPEGPGAKQTELNDRGQDRQIR